MALVAHIIPVEVSYREKYAMSYPDTFILMVMGGVFIIIGIAVLFRGKRQEKSYYNALSTRTDVREFLERSPEHPEHSSLKIGGWISIIVGLVMLGMGGGLQLWG